MAKLTAREELVALVASICVALVLVTLIAGMTLANTVHQTSHEATGENGGQASSVSGVSGHR